VEPSFWAVRFRVLSKQENKASMSSICSFDERTQPGRSASNLLRIGKTMNWPASLQTAHVIEKIAISFGMSKKKLCCGIKSEALCSQQVARAMGASQRRLNLFGSVWHGRSTSCFSVAGTSKRASGVFELPRLCDCKSGTDRSDPWPSSFR